MSQQKRLLIAVLVVFAVLLLIAIKTNKPLPSTGEQTTPAEIATAPTGIEQAKKAPAESSTPTQEDPGSATSPTTPPAGSSASKSQAQTVATPATEKPESTARSQTVEEVAPSENSERTALPRFVEVGAEKCIPCRMMQPILTELRQEYAGQLQVDFVDVWQHPEQADEYRIRSIPTQIIYDSHGKEVFRHIGFWPKDEILAKLRELGIDLDE